MQNAGLDEAQAGIKIAARNINNLRYADDTTLMAESEKELKSLLKVKEESEKTGLKLNIQKTKIMASSPITSLLIDRETIFLDSKITADGDCSHEIKRCFWKKNYDQPRQHIKKQKYYFANKVPSSQSYGFPNSHVCESWTIKKAEHQRIDAFWTVVLEKTLESPLDCKEIHPVHPKGNQSWIFIRRTDAETEALISWPSDAKIWLIEKDPDAGKNWGQEKGMTEDEMVRWHHWLEGHEFEQALGTGDRQGSLECYSPWGCKKSDVIEATELNWTRMKK